MASQNGTRPEKASFLTIPLEVRRMIYKIVLEPREEAPNSTLPPLPHGHDPRVLPLAIPGVRLMPMVKLSQPSKQNAACSKPRYYDYYRIDPMLSAIRCVSSQCYHETSDLVSFPKYRVRITVDDELAGKKLEGVLKVLRYEFVARNAEEVCFQFAGDLVFARNWEVVKEGWWRWMTSTMLGWWRSTKQISDTITFQPTGDSPLKKMVEIMSTYQNLKTMNMKTYETDMFGVWRTPTQDLPAFKPLLEKGVKINIEAGREARNLRWLSRRKLLGELTSGKRDVFLEEQDMKPWVGAPEGAQLYAAKLRTLT